MALNQVSSGGYHSEDISDILLRITPKLDAQKLFDAFATMGPGCLFDDFENEEQVKGAKIVFEWVEAYLDNIDGRSIA